MAIRCKVEVGGLVGEMVLRDVAAPAKMVRKGDPCLKPATIAAVASPLVTDRHREHVVVLTLDARSRVVRSSLISIGSLMSSIIHPREVFRAVIGRSDEEPGSAFAIVHNHPSGDPTPSVEDHQVTRRIADAARLIGITLVDHVVIAWRQDGYLDFRSFAQEGWLD